MIDQTAQLEELPTYWQERISRLRSENHQLRSRLNTANSIELSPRWQKKLTGLRRENGRYRTERNAALAEVAALRAERESRSK